MATQSEIANHIDLSDRQIRNLLKDGVIPGSKGNGGLDIDSCRVAYIRYLRGLGSGQIGEEGKDYDLTKQKAMLTAEQLREKKRENDIADNLVAPISIITNALQNVGKQMVALLEALPLEMKRANPKLTGHDIMMVKKSISKCCDAISRIQIKDDPEE